MVLSRSLLFGTAVLVAFALSCTKEPVPSRGGDDEGDKEEPAPKPEPVVTDAGWLELPAATDRFEKAYTSCFKISDGRRNYSYLYDIDTYTCMWVAYPLYAETYKSGSRYDGDWMRHPDLKANQQINVWEGGYGVQCPDVDATEYYARGHQIPDADRRGVAEMQKQTYYVTNSTPQMQNCFNDHVWVNLENEVRNMVPSGDTLYVVTGAAFNKVGEDKEITYISPRKDPKSCPVPNYYYKVLLKVKRTGDKVTSASTIGFWLEHKSTYSAYDYKYNAVTVNTIETYMGIDFFANLPDDIEEKAEANSSITTFKNFK